MLSQIISRLPRSVFALGLAAAALPLALAQTTPEATVTLLPAYTPNSHLNYSVVMHSSIGTTASLDSVAAIEMDILSGATPGHFTAALQFTHYVTTVKSDSPSTLSALTEQTAATDKAAQTMGPVQFEVSPGTIKVLKRPAGSDFDEPVEMLEELARTDGLPVGPVAVGNHWSVTRSREIPTMNFSVALVVDGQLVSLGNANGQPTATVGFHAHGSTPLPPGALPGSQAMAAQGLVPQASVSFDTNSTSVYSLKDTILLSTTSQTNNEMKVKLISASQPDAAPQNMDTVIHSSSTVKLVGNPAGPAH